MKSLTILYPSAIAASMLVLDCGFCATCGGYEDVAAIKDAPAEDRQTSSGVEPNPRGQLRTGRGGIDCIVQLRGLRPEIAPNRFLTREWELSISDLIPTAGQVFHHGQPKLGFKATGKLRDGRLSGRTAELYSLTCRSLETPKTWNRITYGGQVRTPITHSVSNGLYVKGWALPVGRYEVRAAIVAQERPNGVLLHGAARSHRFRIRPSLTHAGFAEQVGTLIAGTKRTLDQKSGALRWYLNQVSLTPADWDTVGLFTELERLDLSGLVVPKDAIQRLSPLKRLHSLQLDNSAIDADSLQAIRQLKSIRRLDLSRSTVKPGDMAQLAGARLDELQLSSLHLNLTDLQALSRLPKLSNLDLSDAHFIEGIPGGTLVGQRHLAGWYHT